MFDSSAELDVAEFPTASARTEGRLVIEGPYNVEFVGDDTNFVTVFAMLREKPVVEGSL